MIFISFGLMALFTCPSFPIVHPHLVHLYMCPIKASNIYRSLHPLMQQYCFNILMYIILISIIRWSTLLLSQLATPQLMWSSRASFSPKHPRYRICRWHNGLPARGLGKPKKAGKWVSRILQEIQCHDQLAQILCNMAFSWNTSCVASTSPFQMD